VTTPLWICLDRPPTSAPLTVTTSSLREGLRDDAQHLSKVLVHELLHCGLYEDRERRGQPQPRSLDPREEMAVHAMTDVVLKRLNERGREGNG